MEGVTVNLRRIRQAKQGSPVRQGTNFKTTKPFVGGVWARGTPQKAGRPSRPYHGSRAKDDFLADTFGIDKFLTDFRCIDAIWFASIRVPPRDTCIAPVA
jgi:hypothetical protein